MEFFHEQVRILRDFGVRCDVRYSHDLRGTHRDESPLRVISGHNPLYYAIRGSSLYAKVLRASWTADYDIVHVNSGLVAPLGLLQPQRPVVLTLWGDDLLGDRLGGYQSEITKFCAQQSDRVIVRSQEMKDALPCDATIIPSGVDISKFKPLDSTEARDAVGWDDSARHVLFPYPPQREKKRYPLAKRTVAKVNHAVDETVRLQAVYDADHDEMPLYYNAADVLLLPSLREGSPNTVKEAMACNLPVVSTDVGDVRGRLAPVARSHVCSDDSALPDAIRSVLDSGERSDGREYVTDVRLERMGERLVDIYDSLLEESPPRQ